MRVHATVPFFFCLAASAYGGPANLAPHNSNNANCSHLYSKCLSSHSSVQFANAG